MALGALALAETASAQAGGADEQAAALAAEAEQSATEAGAMQLAALFEQDGDWLPPTRPLRAGKREGVD